MSSTIVISIAGGTGSGKSTVARKIISEFKENEVRLINLDDYYKYQEEPLYENRCKVNYDHPNAIDFDLFYDHIKDLKNGKSIDKPVYDFTVHNRSNNIEHIEPAQIIIIEGILSLVDERIRELSDIKLYVDSDSDIRLIRRIRRDMKERARSLDSIISQYTTTVKPMHDIFVESTKKYADIIIPNEHSHEVAVSILKTKITDILKN